MAYGRAAVRYAKSLIELSIERNDLEAVKADMDLIHTTCVESKDLVLLLESPVVKTDKKLSILKAIFGYFGLFPGFLCFLGLLNRGLKGRYKGVIRALIGSYKAFKALIGPLRALRAL